MNLNVKDATAPQVWQVMGESFELERRYKIVDYLGAGAYGLVCAVRDEKENTVVAIKKCKKIFQSKTLAKRTLREVRLLRLFSHENIVKLKCILPPVNPHAFSELYVVFELMETDLAQIIRSPQKLKEQHIQYFTYQLLQALKYLHSANVVHRDIKPRNILVNADCLLKLADFGLARIYTERNDDRVSNLTDYVTTRWYRAPEVIVGWPQYGSAVDMWAVGCIVAELLGRTPLFPGADTMKQMELICRIMGKPDQEFIQRSKKSTYRQYMYSLPPTRSHQLFSVLPYAKPHSIDLLVNLLEYNPAQRYTAEEALAHLYITEINGNEGLVSADCTPLLIPSEEFAFEEREITLDILRSEILQEVKYHMAPVLPHENFRTPLMLMDSPSELVDPPVLRRSRNELTAGLPPAAALSKSLQQCAGTLRGDTAAVFAAAAGPGEPAMGAATVAAAMMEVPSPALLDVHQRRYSVDSKPDLQVDERRHLFQRRLSGKESENEPTPSTKTAAPLPDRTAPVHHTHASAHQFKALGARRLSGTASTNNNYNTNISTVGERERSALLQHQHSLSDKMVPTTTYEWIHSVPTAMSPPLQQMHQQHSANTVEVSSCASPPHVARHTAGTSVQTKADTTRYNDQTHQNATVTVEKVGEGLGFDSQRAIDKKLQQQQQQKRLLGVVPDRPVQSIHHGSAAFTITKPAVVAAPTASTTSGATTAAVSTAAAGAANRTTVVPSRQRSSTVDSETTDRHQQQHISNNNSTKITHRNTGRQYEASFPSKKEAATYFSCLRDSSGEEYKSEFLADFGLDQCEEATAGGGDGGDWPSQKSSTSEEVRRGIRRSSNARKGKGDYCSVM